VSRVTEETGAVDNGAVLAGQRIIVTGASGHLGGALAASLRALGADVIGLARRGDKHIVSCDITDPAAVDPAVAEAIRHLGGLDTLIHCAGIGGPGAIGVSPTDDDHRTMEVNLWGAWRVTSAALPALVEARGRVVFTSSLMAYAATPFSGSYAVSKRALGAYADTLRSEYGSHLLVTTIYPGHFDTPMHDEARKIGLSMDDKVPHEELHDIVEVFLDSVRSADPPLDATTALVGEAGFQITRRLPGAGATLVNRRTRELAQNGELDGVEAAEDFRRLIAEEPDQRQQVMSPHGLARGIRQSVRLAHELVERADARDKVVPIWSMLRPMLDAVADTIDRVEGEPSAVALGLSESEVEALRDAGGALAGQLLQAVLAPPADGAPSILDPRGLALIALNLQQFVDRTAHQIASDAAGKADALRG
jgi:NAD(P)-dependent dehydrogenase (short-subunit alcohol dehydrogenase family)